jgi:hypothetical protein
MSSVTEQSIAAAPTARPSFRSFRLNPINAIATNVAMVAKKTRIGCGLNK